MYSASRIRILLMWVCLAMTGFTLPLYSYLSPSPVSLTLAFVGDTTPNPGLRDLLRAEGLSMIVHQGDFTYHQDPKVFQDWLANFEDTYFMGSIGNHDFSNWPHFVDTFSKHNKRVITEGNLGLHCEGELGIQSYCQIGPILLMNMVSESNSQSQLPSKLNISNSVFIQKTFMKTRKDTIFRICSFHHPHSSLRIQKPKKDQVTLEEYETCRMHGALIVNGHDHIYARTQLFTDYVLQQFKNPDYVPLLEGLETFSIISGLGGRSVDTQDPENKAYQWWAKIFPEKDTDVSDNTTGAVFCVFESESKKAECTFKTTDGIERDKFSFFSRE